MPDHTNPTTTRPDCWSAKCPECDGRTAVAVIEDRPVHDALFVAPLIADGLVVERVSLGEARTGFGHADSCSKPRPGAKAFAIHCTVGDSSETYDGSELGDCVADAEYFIREMNDGDVLLIIKGGKGVGS